MDKVLLASSVVGGWVAFLFGGWHISLTVLGVFMAIDILTGIMKAIVTKELNSKIGYKGYMKKVGIMFAVILANMIDLLTGGEFLFRSMTVLFFVGLEALSIVENLGRIGVPLPEQLTKYLAQLSNKNEK